MPGLRLLAHGAGGAARHPGDHGVRRPARAAQAARRGRPCRHLRQPAGDLLPDRVGARVVLGRRAGAPRRRGARAGGAGAGRGASCSARVSTSSGPRCAGATSSTSPRTRCSPGVLGAAMVDGVQSQGVGTSRQALRGQQPGDRPAAGQRADVDERTLREIYLAGFEYVVTAGAAVDGDVRLQPGQRDVRLGARAGCSPTCCATSGASTGSSSPTGARSTTGWPPLRPGSTSRCRRTSASATPRSSPPSAPASWTRRVLDRGRGPGAAAGRPGRRQPPSRLRWLDADATTRSPGPRRPSARCC